MATVKSNSLYQGTVTLKKLDSKKVLHNTSTALLSKIFAQALLFKYVDSTPSYIDLGIPISGSTEKYQRVLLPNEYVQATGGTLSINSDGRYVATYNALITYKSLSSEEHTGTPSLYLLDNNKNVLASVATEEGTTVEDLINAQDALQVDWELCLVD